MTIDGIKNGYVIDHIKPTKSLEIYNLLNLKEKDCAVALITNVKSKKLKKKDILKIDKLIDIDFDKLSFIDPNITINVIKNNKVIEKKKLGLPEKIINIKQCKNPRCITSTERNLDHIFILSDKEKGIYRCLYCEQELDKIN